MPPMSRLLLWWDAEKGPQKAAHASPQCISLLAKKSEEVAVNPLEMVQASPTKQLQSLAPDAMLAFWSMMQLSRHTSSPMFTSP